MLRFINKFIFKVVYKHAPLKKKTITENHASFVNKELRKAIYTRSRLRNNMCQNPISKHKRLQKPKKQMC